MGAAAAAVVGIATAAAAGVAATEVAEDVGSRLGLDPPG